MQNPPISRSTILGAAGQGYGARSRRGVLHNPLISRSKRRNGTNSAHAFSHSRMIAGYRFSHFPLNSANRSSASDSDAAVQAGLMSFAICPQSRFEAYLNEFRRR